AARRGRHENVPARRHFLPALLLDRRWFGKRGAKPVTNGRREKIESMPHDNKFDEFQRYKQVFFTGRDGDPAVIQTDGFRDVRAGFPVERLRRGAAAHRGLRMTVRATTGSAA